MENRADDIRPCRTGGVRMMSAWHLLWIVPVSGSLGFFFCALLSMNGRDTDD